MMKIQIILAGIGGQGTLFASKIFGEIGQKLGLNIVGSETHGMSQRGGSVIAHIKLGDFHSPMIRSGTADILYSFEENETYRTLKYLKRGGICFVNLSAQDRLKPNVVKHLEEKDIRIFACDASGKALEIGSVLSANIVLIGYSVGIGLTPFTYGDLGEVLKSASKGRNIEINLKAFEAGFLEGKKQQVSNKLLGKSPE